MWWSQGFVKSPVFHICVCSCSVPFRGTRVGWTPIQKQVLRSDAGRQQRYFGVLKLGVTVMQHNCAIRIAMTVFILWCVLLQVFCVWVCVSGTAINSKIGSLTEVTNTWLAAWPRTLPGIGEALFWRPDESPISLSLNLFECSRLPWRAGLCIFWILSVQLLNG